MSKLFVVLLLLNCASGFAQDKMEVFRKDRLKTEIFTSTIDSVTFPVESIMRIHNWNATITDIPLAEIDSVKTIPDLGNVNTDREVIIALYNATHGSNWTNNTNWCSEKPLNEWYGISTNSEGRVIEIKLRENKLSGNIPSDLGQLTKLVVLDLALNELSGTIPPELGNLSNLGQLWLLSNELSGNIPPELGKLKKLWSLLLSNNQMSGIIPIELSYMKSLTVLDLTGNQFTGSIPSELSELSNLEWLYLGYNELTGAIPKEFGKLSKIKYLFLSTNQLSGAIHPDLVPIFLNLKYLDITRNKFSGTLPLALVNHPRWNEFAWYIFPMNGFRRAPVNVVDFIADDIDGNKIDFKTIRQNNKLTVVYGWTSWCSAEFFETMRTIYQRYSDKGLGLLAFNRFDGGDTNLVRNIIENYQLTWTNAIETPTNGVPYFKEFIESPGIFVVNQLGEIVFSSWMWDKADDIEDFIASQLGPVDLYESQDYSKDGIVKQLQQASSGIGVNLILMGDGFVDTTFVSGGLYDQRMHETMEHFFSIEPTNSYRDYFNVYVVNAVSKNGVFRDSSETVFKAKFGEKTFISGDMTKISEYAQKVEGIKISETHIITVLNSPVYAGICYMFDDASVAFTPVVAYDQKEFASIIHHEAVGHGLGKLGDEYIYYNGTIEDSYKAELLEMQLKGWFQNLSVSSTVLPWSHFLGNSNYSMVSTFEGGYFFTNGVWRAEQNNCMINNIPYFNAPSREQIVKRILKSSGVSYSWEDFVSKDKYEPPSKSVPSTLKKGEYELLSPPVIMGQKLFK